MSTQNINKSVMSGMMWTILESVVSKVAAFVITIILARLLTPDEYGTIAIVTIIITFLDVIVVSGMGSSLIQKKNADNLDFSSVTWMSMGIALILYVLIFAFSPNIARFFNKEELDLIIKVMGLKLFLCAFNSVQSAYVSKHMLFRIFFISTVLSTVISGAIGIVMAYRGYGAWALVGQSIMGSVIGTIVLRRMTPLRIMWKCSIERLKGLFSYGWNLLCSSLLDTLYDEIVGLSIGKKYSAADLSFYDKGKQIPSSISAVVNSSMSKSIFPAMSKIQDQNEEIRKLASNNIKMTSMLMFPALVLLMVIAEPLIFILFTDKWIEAAFYMEILSIYYLLKPFSTVNINITKALGYSDIILKNNLWRKIGGIIVVILSVYLFESPKYVVIGVLITGLIDVIINMQPNKKLVNYGIIDQVKDAFPFVVSSVFCGVLVYFINTVINNIYLLVFAQVVSMSALYLFALAVTKNSDFQKMVIIFKNRIKKMK